VTEAVQRTWNRALMRYQRKPAVRARKEEATLDWSYCMSGLSTPILRMRPTAPHYDWFKEGPGYADTVQ